ncbi:choice-of-anchor A family protein [Reinekea sp. G2M2-21]|uniref:choice-of-anchor A family protein n=1 Tax=Reinekea sp. G2M2-21 TaxID=2788942 RepID=UPI0018A9F73A|nr:choice-of-anchor A family protein [Reinekea sp. G2M2-21]
MKHYLKGIAVLVMSGFSMAFALPLNDYNLILFSDYDFQGGDVEGKTLVGGNLNASGFGTVFGSDAPSFGNTLTVAGDVNATNLTVENGNLLYGGALNVSNVNMNGGGSVTQSNGIDLSSIQFELQQASQGFSALGTNGVYDTAAKTLQYSGSDATAIFNVSASDLFAQNTSLRLNSGSAQNVVINVSGKNITAGGGTNLVDGFRHSDIGAGNILWNFFEAETIDFNNLAMFGSVLATSADLRGGAVFDGAVAANSYVGAREFHNFLYSPPSVNVDEPTTLAMLLVSLVALVRRRKA